MTCLSAAICVICGRDIFSRKIRPQMTQMSTDFRADCHPRKQIRGALNADPMTAAATMGLGSPC